MVAIPDEFWEEQDARLVELLTRHLINASTVAGRLAIDMLPDTVDVDWELINEQVRNWSRSMSLDLVKGITETSRKFTTDAIAEWIESGQELGKLAETLEPMFGTVRSQMIAETEVTRAYAEGSRAAWRLSGVVDGQKWFTAVDELVCPVCGPQHGEVDALDGDFGGLGPPAHPRCRCWTQPVVSI